MVLALIVSVKIFLGGGGCKTALHLAKGICAFYRGLSVDIKVYQRH